MRYACRVSLAVTLIPFGARNLALILIPIRNVLGCRDVFGHSEFVR